MPTNLTELKQHCKEQNWAKIPPQQYERLTKSNQNDKVLFNLEELFKVIAAEGGSTSCWGDPNCFTLPLHFAQWNMTRVAVHLRLNLPHFKTWIFYSFFSFCPDTR